MELAQGLEQLANHLKTSDEKTIQNTIKTVREIVGAALVAAHGQAQGLPLQELDHELATWQSKLSVILNEPVGRRGMEKHARYWAEKLKNV